MKKLFNKYVICLLMLIASSSSFAFSECTREVKNVWNKLDSPPSVWVCFNTGSCIYKSENQLTSGQMERLFSMALTAQTAGLRLRVRYPEDNLVCPPTGDSRNDVLGMWLID